MFLPGNSPLAQSVAPQSAFEVRKSQDHNQTQVYLVKQDQSDCTNGNVLNVDSPLVGGNIWVSRDSSGNTNVKIATTVSPNTTYHFYLKCVRQLGDIRTGDEGTGFATFSFPTSSVGNVFAFDMYPEGAPAGNKYQSAQVSFR
jgi:hypothetical protein